jgi:two-component system phosphate regulon response regulator PhoB
MKSSPQGESMAPGQRRSDERRMASNTILLVEDEPEIREMLVFALDRAGFGTIAAASAEEALQKLEGPLPALAIVDWMLPGASGVELARRLRRDELTRDLPLIMLTARSEEADKLKSFDSGIDDYVTKPFSPRELVARVKALLRRTGAPNEGVLEAGDMALDVVGHRLTIGGAKVHLGPTEFRLLEYLMQHPNRAFDRAQLLDRVWGRSVYVEERTVDVHVLRLRKALASHGRDRCIETVRGVGYRFVPS